jgi:hypothetical protein
MPLSPAPSELDPGKITHRPPPAYGQAESDEDHGRGPDSTLLDRALAQQAAQQDPFPLQDAASGYTFELTHHSQAIGEPVKEGQPAAEAVSQTFLSPSTSSSDPYEHLLAILSTIRSERSCIGEGEHCNERESHTTSAEHYTTLLERIKGVLAGTDDQGRLNSLKATSRALYGGRMEQRIPHGQENGSANHIAHPLSGGQASVRPPPDMSQSRHKTG